MDRLTVDGMYLGLNNFALNGLWSELLHIFLSQMQLWTLGFSKYCVSCECIVECHQDQKKIIAKLINSYFKLVFCFMVGGFPHVYGFYECFYLSMLIHMDADIFDVNKVWNCFGRELNEIRKRHLRRGCNYSFNDIVTVTSQLFYPTIFTME